MEDGELSSSPRCDPARGMAHGYEVSETRAIPIKGSHDSRYS